MLRENLRRPSSQRKHIYWKSNVKNLTQITKLGINLNTSNFYVNSLDLYETISLVFRGGLFVK